MRRNDSRRADNNPAFHIRCQNDWSGCEKRVLFFAKRDSNPKISVRQQSDGGRSSMVELQIVVLVVAGSSPVGHPIFNFVSVAQPDRASDFGSEGCGFESLQARIFPALLLGRLVRRLVRCDRCGLGGRIDQVEDHSSHHSSSEVR